MNARILDPELTVALPLSQWNRVGLALIRCGIEARHLFRPEEVDAIGAFGRELEQELLEFSFQRRPQ